MGQPGESLPIEWFRQILADMVNHIVDATKVDLSRVLPAHSCTHVSKIDYRGRASCSHSSERERDFSKPERPGQVTNSEHAIGRSAERARPAIPGAVR